MLKVYDFTGSGNGYKVWLLMSQLGLPFERIERDILKGETRTPAFLEKNPNGRIPTLELEDGTYLFESGAILWYLAEGTPFAPSDRLARAKTLQWMFFEQYSHEPYIAVARFQRLLLGKSDDEIESRLMQRGEAALARMDLQLAQTPYLVNRTLSLADVALVAYTRVAHEGGFDLSRHPAVKAWVGRVEAALRITD